MSNQKQLAAKKTLIDQTKRIYAYDHFYYNQQQHWKRIFLALGILAVVTPALSMIVNSAFDPCSNKTRTKILYNVFGSFILILNGIIAFVDAGSKRKQAETAGDQYRNLSSDLRVRIKSQQITDWCEELNSVTSDIVFLRDRFEEPPIGGVEEILKDLKNESIFRDLDREIEGKVEDREIEDKHKEDERDTLIEVTNV